MVSDPTFRLFIKTRVYSQLFICDHRFEWRIIILLHVFINSWFTFMYIFVVYGKHKYVQRSKIYSWGKRIWMANYTSLTLIWCACIFVDSLSKKRERDANLHHVHITLTSLICASHKHVLIIFLLKKSYIKRWNNNFSSKKEIQNRKTLQNLFICSICD